MLGVLAAVATALPAPLAALRFDLDGATIAAVVADDGSGPRLVIACEARCRVPLRFSDATGDAPLGLFRLNDAAGLLVSIGAGGSAYRVRVYDIRARGVRKLLEASTLGSPEFVNGAGGATIVRTTERSDRDPPSAPPRIVTWTLRHGRFVRK